MVNITVPIQVFLPDDWIEQIVNRLRDDPESEWVEIVRCKDCKNWDEITNMCGKTQRMALGTNGFCSRAERKDGEEE